MRLISIMPNPALDGITECNAQGRWFYNRIRADVPEATAFGLLFPQEESTSYNFLRWAQLPAFCSNRLVPKLKGAYR
jgi:hypothetical protein